MLKKRNRFIGVIVLLVMVVAAQSEAGDIKKGTFSIGASSDASFTLADTEGYDSSSFSISLESGYFILQNLEVGASVLYSYYDGESYDAYGVSLVPFLMYHFPITENTNIFLGGGGGYGYYNFDEGSGCDSNSTSSLVYGEVGWEYFFTPNVTLNIGLRGQRRFSSHESDCYDDGDIKTDTLTTGMRLKLYF